MIQPVNISPLPFYPNIGYQALRNPSYRANLQSLVIDKNRLPPFQIVIGNYKYINSISLVPIDTNRPIEIKDEMVAMGLEIKQVGDYNLMVFPSNGKFTIPISEGLYYISVIISNSQGQIPLEKEFWVSEVFSVNTSLTEYIELTYGNTHNLEYHNGIIDFESGFKFRVLIPTSLGQPKYPYIEEGKSRGGYTFIERIISSKVYQFAFLASEYLVDALRIFKLCDNRMLSYNGKEYEPLTANMDVEWQTENIALVSMEVGVDNIVASLGQGLPVQNETNIDI